MDISRQVNFISNGSHPPVPSPSAPPVLCSQTVQLSSVVVPQLGHLSPSQDIITRLAQPFTSHHYHHLSPSQVIITRLAQPFTSHHYHHFSPSQVTIIRLAQPQAQDPSQDPQTWSLQ